MASLAAASRLELRKPGLGTRRRHINSNTSDLTGVHTTAAMQSRVETKGLPAPHRAEYVPRAAAEVSYCLYLAHEAIGGSIFFNANFYLVRPRLSSAVSLSALGDAYGIRQHPRRGCSGMTRRPRTRVNGAGTIAGKFRTSTQVNPGGAGGAGEILPFSLLSIVICGCLVCFEVRHAIPQVPHADPEAHRGVVRGPL